MWYAKKWDTIVLSPRPHPAPKIAGPPEQPPTPPSPAPLAPSPNTAHAEPTPMSSATVAKKAPVHHELSMHAAKTAVASIVTGILAGAAAFVTWLWHRFHAGK